MKNEFSFFYIKWYKSANRIYEEGHYEAPNKKIKIRKNGTEKAKKSNRRNMLFLCI